MRISCIIPSYNRAGLIGETLRSMLEQSRPPHEVIVVDDGSTDSTPDVVTGFGKAVTLIRQANAGPAAARNRGLAAANGDFIQFMDSDDLSTRDKFEVQARALEASAAPFVYGPWLQARLADGIAAYPELPLQQRALPAGRSALSCYLGGWVTVFQCCLFRRSVLDAVGPYREELMIAEDLELLFRILARGGEPLHVPGPLVLYRLHPGHQISIGGTPEPRRAGDWSAYLGIVAEQLDRTPGVSRADRERWRWLQREAADVLGSLGLEAPRLPPPGFASQARWQGGKLAKRLEKAISRRLSGRAFPAAYGQGPLTPAQEQALAAIGYRAVRG